MLREYINRRLDLLKLVLQYRKENPDVLTAGEQICINQERARLLRQQDDEGLEDYIQPEHLQKKIIDLLQTIKKTRWTPQEENEY